MAPMPMLKLNGNILYILRGEQIIAVSIDSAKVLADNMLMQPPMKMKNRPQKNEE